MSDDDDDDELRQHVPIVVRVRVIIHSLARATSCEATATMIVPVTTSVWGLEYSVHECPKRHKAEAEAMFPGLDVSDLLVVPTCQVRLIAKTSRARPRKSPPPGRARRFVPPPRLDRPSPTPPRPPRVPPHAQRTKMDLVQTGESVDTEKDFCLERFMTFAKNVTDRLIAAGHWADYIDPCSGLSMVNKDSQQIYGEVDALVTLLNYQTTNSGCCKVVLHPTWGSAVYPASIFTKAPPAALADAIAEAEKDIRAAEGDA